MHARCAKAVREQRRNRKPLSRVCSLNQSGPLKAGREDERGAAVGCRWIQSTLCVESGSDRGMSLDGTLVARTKLKMRAGKELSAAEAGDLEPTVPVRIAERAQLADGTARVRVVAEGGGRLLGWVTLVGKDGQNNLVPNAGAAADDHFMSQLKGLLKPNLARLRSVFLQWDSNGDGKVSRVEFNKAMKALQLEAPGPTVDLLFDRIDGNSSGFIEFKELETALQTVVAAPPRSPGSPCMARSPSLTSATPATLFEPTPSAPEYAGEMRRVICMHAETQTEIGGDVLTTARVHMAAVVAAANEAVATSAAGAERDVSDARLAARRMSDACAAAEEQLELLVAQAHVDVQRAERQAQEQSIAAAVRAQAEVAIARVELHEKLAKAQAAAEATRKVLEQFDGL